MPSATRALSRAARERAQDKGIPYTKAREQLLWIEQLLDEGAFDTREEADAYVCDPANEVMCRACGWTYGMVCPECPGCGCYNGRCSGWRHREWASQDEDDPEDRYDECPECGGEYDVRTGYGCACNPG